MPRARRPWAGPSPSNWVDRVGVARCFERASLWPVIWQRWLGCIPVAVALVGCGDGSGDEPGVEFSDLRVEDIAADRAVVRFETSIETTCEVEYGTTPGELELSATDPDMDPQNPFAIEHRVPLEDLPAETTIYFRAKVTTPGGRSFYSDDDSFQTLEEGATGTQDMSNVALLEAGAQVVGVSSNFGGAENDESWGADAAFDGRMGTEWSTNGDGDDAFVEIELSASQTIEAFGFRSRMMTDGSSIIESVRLLLDGDTELGPFETPDPDRHYLFELDQPISTSQVRVEAVKTSGGNTGAREIELYARE